MESPSPRSFWCFISYRHADNKEPGRQWATWLHQQIETYEVPADLVGTVNGRGDKIPERIFPVFRDEDELPADADLSSPIYRALDASKFLVVLCSPRAVQSSYVADEIAYYKKIGGSDRVLAAVLDGEPRESFPVPLRHPVDANGVPILGEHSEPIAADFRLPDDTEGWTSPEAYRLALAEAGIKRAEIERRVTDYKARLELGKLKIIAGILGIALGTLTQRDKAYQLEKERRRARIFRRVTAAMAVLLVAAIAGGIFAMQKKQEAETQRQSAVSARDAEAAQRSLAESRRLEADTARGVAETRRTEAEAAKSLAEQRRVESETRLGRSNILLADRLTREGNTRDAADALWEVPEQERQWEWGYLLGRAYQEAHLVSADGLNGAGAPQGAGLNPQGTRAAFWPPMVGEAVEGAVPVPLKSFRLEDDGSTGVTEIPVKSGVVSAIWGRSGKLAFVDGDALRIFSPEGKEIGQPQRIDAEGEDIGSFAFIGAGDGKLVLKTGEIWRIFDISPTGFSEATRVEEAFEMERFEAVSPDGKQWLAASSDSGVTLYDDHGRVLHKFEGMWQSRGSFADDGTVAVASISGDVLLRFADGKLRRLAEGEGVIQHLTNKTTVCWLGRQLFVRTIHLVRAWDLRRRPAEGDELPVFTWSFADEDSTDTMAVSESWVAVSLLNGAIAVSPNIDDLSEVDRLQGHRGMLGGMAFASPDCLASAGQDGTLRYWFPESHIRSAPSFKDIQDPLFKGRQDVWNPLQKEEDGAPPRPVTPGMPFGTLVKIASPDKARYASAGDDGQIRIWKGKNADELMLAIPTPGKRSDSLAFSIDGRRLGGESMTPGEQVQFEKEWLTQPWTRQQLGIDEKADWRAAFKSSLEKRFKDEWVKQRKAPKE